MFGERRVIQGLLSAATLTTWFVIGVVADARGQDPVIFAGKTGAELRGLLREEYSPGTLLNYTQARIMMFGVVDNNDGKVELAYTTEFFPIRSADPIPDADGPNGVNTEHTWPQSMFGGLDGPGMKTDLHHLFPCRTIVNSARGSLPFSDLDDATETRRWWNGQTPLLTKPTMNVDAFSEQGPGRFEPEEDHKGNVARAMVYFYTIYENEPTLRKSFFTPQISFFRRWHVSDGADDREKDRGRRIERIQGNLNPFAIDPTLLQRALSDFPDLPAPRLAAQGASAAAEAEAVPSPAVAQGVTDPIAGVKIIALLPNPIGIDENKESVTLANPAGEDADLAGWTLKDQSNRVFKLAGKIPAGQTLCVPLVNSAMILGNNGGEITLIDAQGAPRRAVSYAKEQAKPGAFVLFGD